MAIFSSLNPKCSRNYVWVHFYYCARHKFNLHFRECPRFFMFPLSLTKIGDKFHILQCWYLFWIRDIWEVLKILGRQICFLGFLRKNRKNSDSWLQTPVTDGEYWKFKVFGETFENIILLKQSQGILKIWVPAPSIVKMKGAESALLSSQSEHQC